MARLHQLPIEVRARICEFIGDIADAPSDYQLDPLQQDDFFSDEYYKATGSTYYSLVYKDLRSLALASKAFTDSAQRVLFRIAVVGGPSMRCIMRLLKSLLLYPKNRRYVRSLFVTRSTYPAARAGDTLDQLKQFHRELRPLILTGKIDELYDASFFRGFEAGVSLGVCYNKDDWSTIATEFVSGFTTKVADYVSRAIIQLCPFLSGFHICCNYCGSRSRDLEPETVEVPTVPASLDDGPSNTFPQLKSLTLNYDALLDQVDSIVARPRYPGGCPPNIERLTLMDFQFFDSIPICLNFIHSWIRSNTSLKELRVIAGFDDRLNAFFDDSITRKRNENWNTILPLFKDTLELLVFDGYKRIHEDSEVRFGPTRMLSCLGDFEKLAYLKVPLHMLRQDSPKLCVPRKGQQVLDLVQAKLPKGLKKMDIVVFGRGELAENTFEWEQNLITPIKTFQVRL